MDPFKLDIPVGWAVMVMNVYGELVTYLYSPSTMPRVTPPVSHVNAQRLDIVAIERED